MAEMTAAHVADLQTLFHRIGIDVWFDGGWAVDAVLGEQTRAHDDLDIIVCGFDVEILRQALATRGFREEPGGREANFVLADPSGLKVDVHVIALNPSGDGIYQMEDGSEWVFSAESLSGTGMVGGVDVQCLTPKEQVHCHATGYQPREKDLKDMARLQARFQLVLPPGLAQE